VKPIVFVVPGKIPSKKNMYHIGMNRQTGRRRIILTEAVRDYQKKVWAYATKVSVAHGFRLIGPLSITLTAYVKNIKQDVDNMVGAIFDGLKQSRLIEDDAQFYNLHVHKRMAGGKQELIISIGKAGEDGEELPEETD